MSATGTIETMLAGAIEAADAETRANARQAARAAWLGDLIAALKAAQQSVNEAWARRLEAIPDDVDDETLDDVSHPQQRAKAGEPPRPSLVLGEERPDDAIYVARSSDDRHKARHGWAKDRFSCGRRIARPLKPAYALPCAVKAGLA